MNIVNYLQISDIVSTSGQPAAEDFARMAEQGFTSVINLALPTSDHAIADEGAIVTGHGMNYFHIPVLWDAPRPEQYRAFTRLMDAYAHDRTWVHCVMNMRVSCFMYLRHRELGTMGEPEARALMHRVWQPNENWREFIDRVASEYAID